jgi:hypothetical protein
MVLTGISISEVIAMPKQPQQQPENLPYALQVIRQARAVAEELQRVAQVHARQIQRMDAVLSAAIATRQPIAKPSAHNKLTPRLPRIHREEL